jgi:AraC-like DNA-binding protein
VNPRLGNLVRSMWTVDGPAEEAVLPGIVAPDAHVEFVFHFGAPWKMQRTGEWAWHAQPRAFFYAQRHRSLRFEGAGHVELMAFRISSVVARRLLGMSIADCWDTVVPLESVLGSDAEAIHAKLQRTNPRQRGVVLEAWLERRLSDWNGEDSESERLLHSVFWKHHHQSIEAIAARLGPSVRSLRRRLGAAAAMSPKDAQLSGRVLVACALLRDRADLTITDIASRVGFYDHAAFTHAFSDRIGLAPGQLRALPHVFFERGPGL